MRHSVCTLAIYVHCWAHRLNMVVVACVYGIDRANRFFVHMQMIYKFFLRQCSPRLLPGSGLNFPIEMDLAKRGINVKS